MARPRGEVRQALADAIARLHAERGAVSGREMAEAAQVGYEVARETIKDMRRAGELIAAGSVRQAGQRWHTLYEPASAAEHDLPEAQAWCGIEALAGVMHLLAQPIVKKATE